jgi:hypothetical protein
MEKRYRREISPVGVLGVSPISYNKFPHDWGIKGVDSMLIRASLRSNR